MVKRYDFQGPVVQNLTKLLAKVTLKFLSWNIASTLIYFAKKIYFCSKNVNLFKNTLTTTVNEFVD